MKQFLFFSFIVLASTLLLFSMTGTAVAVCSSDADCDDTNFCTDDSCNVGTGECVFTDNDTNDCGDGIFCNGIEACLSGVCIAGLPVDCDDGVACTADSCSEEFRSCKHTVPDADFDGHGDANCVDGAGMPLGDDCNDQDNTRFAGSPEVCDSDDEDCDPETFGNRDQDGDGFIDLECCNGTNGSMNCGDDCDDMELSVHPIQNEVCNGVDDDCDGDIDMASEGVGGSLTKSHFPDSDGDGYGDPATSFALCPGEPGFSMLGNDCDDTKAAIFPGAMICGAPANPTNVMVCMSDGTFALGSCDPNTKSVCVMQPNGTGICQPKKG